MSRIKAHLYYFIGDMFSRFDIFFQDSEWFGKLWYTPYNYFMLKSYSFDVDGEIWGKESVE